MLRTTHVLLAPNDKEMRWRLCLALVLLSPGLPAAAALTLRDESGASVKAGDGASVLTATVVTDGSARTSWARESGPTVRTMIVGAVEGGARGS